MTDTDHIPPVLAHTPGPWHVHNHVHVHGAAGQRIASVKGEFGDPAKSANANRIVAAVNACQGIGTEALEQGVIGDLLEALERLVYDASGNQDNPMIRVKTVATIEQARVIIAKATGRPS
jgi:hypothetical protein